MSSVFFRCVSHLIPKGLGGLGLLLLTVSVLPGCISYQLAPNAFDQPEVVEVVEQVLQKHYYQTRPYRSSGHVIAYSQPYMEGTNKVRKRIDVYVRYENTGHFMPLVHVRKYYDLQEPEIETGNFASPYHISGDRFAKSNWNAIHWDHYEEEKLRKEILSALKADA